MLRLLWVLAGIAAAGFVVGSATTNAVFLSSLGRTRAEGAIYICVSIASDLAKVVLPVAIAHAAAKRAWVQGALCAGALAGTILLSVASGTGFAALTRGTVMGVRDATAARIAAQESERAALLPRLTRVEFARELAVVEVALSAAWADRRWAASKKCAEPSGASARQFCAETAQLQIEEAAARERERLAAAEKALRLSIEALRAERGAAGIDPQVDALAALVDVTPEKLRARLMLGLALVMELGGIVLVLLIAGPLLSNAPATTAAGTRKSEEREIVNLPAQVDRSFWLRRSARRPAAVIGGGDGDDK